MSQSRSSGLTGSSSDSLVVQIDALLPQTQCRKCGYQGCLPYAQAISENHADINQCPPGGAKGIAQLANLLGVAVKPLATTFGVERPRMKAVIKEAECIGCAKCLPPCPVDAIIGSSKQMHTVIVNQCTGCELCIVACPVNCIVMAESELAVWSGDDAQQARQRYQARNRRLAKQEAEKIARLNRQKQKIAELGKVKTVDC